MIPSGEIVTLLLKKFPEANGTKHAAGLANSGVTPAKNRDQKWGAADLLTSGMMGHFTQHHDVRNTSFCEHY